MARTVFFARPEIGNVYINGLSNSVLRKLLLLIMKRNYSICLSNFVLLNMSLFVLTAAAQGTRDENVAAGIGEVYVLGTSLLEAEGGFTKRFEFPFLRGENPLTAGNGVKLALTAKFSPVSINGLAEAVWTPVAFFQLAAGGRAGSGWYLDFFGGDNYGLSLNLEDSAGCAEIAKGGLDGAILKAHGGGALQFDLSAIIPGGWNHVVARTYHEFNYKTYTAAKKGEAWYDENDDGENCNGANYYGNLLIGYQMPVFVNTIALLAEAHRYLYNYDTHGFYRDGWRENDVRWVISGVTQYTLTNQLDAALIAQFRTRKNYTDDNWKELYYRNRNINKSDPQRVEFYRLVAALTYKL